MPRAGGLGQRGADDRADRGFGGEVAFSGDVTSEVERPPEAPSPPTGIPLGPTASAAGPPDGDDDDDTPPAGIKGLSEVVSSEDFGSGGPTVFGGVDPVAEHRQRDAGDWPTLTYRSKNTDRSKRNSRGALDWLRGRSEAG